MVADLSLRVKAETSGWRTDSQHGKVAKMNWMGRSGWQGWRPLRSVVLVAMITTPPLWDDASGQVIGLGSGGMARRQPAPAAEQLPAGPVIEPDAFVLLEGSRPDFTGSARTTAVVTPAGAEGKQPWSALISGATLADEVKLSLPPLQQATASQTAFNSKLAAALDRFHLVAVVFGLMSAYDKPNDIRTSWRAAAAGLRDRFARVASHVDRDGGEAFSEARTRAEDLAALILGETVAADPNEKQPFQWSQLCDRAVLMRRLKAADGVLTQATASAEAFADAPEKLLHEAEIIAAFAALIVQEAFTDWDDDTYREYAATMQREAVNLRKAVQQADYETAGRTAKAVTQSCATCHDDYR
jgi:hypothetical protein